MLVVMEMRFINSMLFQWKTKCIWTDTPLSHNHHHHYCHHLPLGIPVTREAGRRASVLELRNSRATCLRLLALAPLHTNTNVNWKYKYEHSLKTQIKLQLKTQIGLHFWEHHKSPFPWVPHTEHHRAYTLRSRSSSDRTSKAGRPRASRSSLFRLSLGKKNIRQEKKYRKKVQDIRQEKSTGY